MPPPEATPAPPPEAAVVATPAADAPGPGWHPDPIDPARRLRWWTGDAWSSRVVTLEVGSEAISWHHRIDDHAAPGTVASPPVSPAARPPLHPETDDVAALLDTFEPEPKAKREPTRVTTWLRTREPRRRRYVSVVAAAALMIAAAAGAGTALLGDDDRPSVEQTTLYRDAKAGFTLRYPDRWHKGLETAGEGVRFEVGAADSAPIDANTVSVVVGTESAPLPALHSLADDVTERLVVRFPGLRLESAERTTLADSPAYRISLSDGSTEPPTRILQVVGRTTSGRPLSVTFTVREPRTAPTDAETKEFLASIKSG
jgi:hypothetical protein